MNAIWFQPDVEDAAKKLIEASQNFEKINATIDRLVILDNYSWDNISRRFMDLCRG